MPNAGPTQPAATGASDAEVSLEGESCRGEATIITGLSQASEPWVALLEDDEDQGALLQHWLAALPEPPRLRWFKSARALFEALAMPARETTGGAAGEPAAEEASPRLLLCDYELGDANALEVLARISAPAGQQPRPVVVVMSAHTNPARRAAALAAGASGWLTKPLSRDVVQQAVMHWLAQWRAS